MIKYYIAEIDFCFGTTIQRTNTLRKSTIYKHIPSELGPHSPYIIIQEQDSGIILKVPRGVAKEALSECDPKAANILYK